MSFMSQISQDKLVAKLLNNKKSGFFVDIGCNKPRTISNTFYLETVLGWKGIAIDIKNLAEDSGETWEQLRPKTTLVIQDALTIDYESLFSNSGAPTVIDFLSMDLSPADKTLECLYKIPFDKYQFKTITYETDAFRLADGIGGDKRAKDSRLYLMSKGYILVDCMNMRPNGRNQDDFYILGSELTK